MTGFIAADRRRREPGRLDLLQHAVRGRPAAVRDHAGHQHDQHRLRPSLQAGLLMSVAASHRPRGRPRRSPPASSRDRNTGVAGLPRAAVVLAVLRRHGAARADRRHRHRRARRASTPRCSPTTTPRSVPRRPASGPASSAAVADGHHRPARRPARHRRGALPRGVRRQPPVVQPAHRAQPAEPRRRARRSSTACSPWR